MLQWSAAVALGGWGCLPRGVSLGGVSQHALGRGVPAPVHAGIHPPREQNDWQTPVKILPCRNFIADSI